jgi:hypothetical protein
MKYVVAAFAQGIAIILLWVWHLDIDRALEESESLEDWIAK